MGGGLALGCRAACSCYSTQVNRCRTSIEYSVPVITNICNIVILIFIFVYASSIRSRVALMV